MSKIEGGILGTVKGKIGNIVFSEARGREQKINTVREFVKPTNPQTSAQTTQRNKFDSVVRAARLHGSSLWDTLFNRAVGNLPGFQSFVSHHLNYMVSDYEFELPADLNTGSLDYPDSFSAATGAGSGEVDLTWSTEIEAGGSADDQCNLYGMTKSNASVDAIQVFAETNFAQRDAGSYTWTAPGGGVEVLLGMYLNKNGEDVYSPISYVSATTGTT